MAVQIDDALKVKVEVDTDGVVKKLELITKELKKIDNSVNENSENTRKAIKESADELKKSFSKTALSGTKNAIQDLGLAGSTAMGLLNGAIIQAALSMGELRDQLVFNTGNSDLIWGDIIDIATKFGFSIEEISKVLGELSKVFGLSGDDLQKYGIQVLKIAKILGIDATQLINVFKTLFDAGFDTTQLEGLMDILALLQQNVGNFDGAEFLKFLQDNSSIIAKLSDTEIKKLIQAYAALTAGMGDASFLTDVLNKAFEESIMTGESLSAVLARYVDTLKTAAGSPTELLRIAKLLGVEVSDLEKIIDALNGNFNDMDWILDGTNGALDDMWGKVDNLNQQWQIFKNNIAITLSALGQMANMLFAVLNPALQLFNSILLNSEGNLSMLGRAIGFVVVGFGTMKIIGSMTTLMNYFTGSTAAATKAVTALKFALLGLGIFGVMGAIGGWFGGGSSSDSNSASGFNTDPSGFNLNPNIDFNGMLPQSNSTVVDNTINANFSLDGKLLSREVSRHQTKFANMTAQNLEDQND